MENEILKLIYDYSINNKLVDNDYINNLISTIVSYKGLNDWLNLIYFVNETVSREKNTLRVADYNLIDKYLSINIGSMNAYIESYTNYYYPSLNDFEKKLFGNYLVTQIILHELEHVSQNKMYNSYNYDTESKLIRMGFAVSYMLADPLDVIMTLKKNGYNANEINELLRHQVELYKKYYPCNPTERLAQIKSYVTMTDILEPIYDRVPNIYMYNSHEFFQNLLLGYEIEKSKVSCPTEIYINGMGYQQEWTNFDFYNQDSNIMLNNIFNDYSKVQRLSFGLPVTETEYNDTKKLLMKCGQF